MNSKNRQDTLTLGILEAIEERSDVTQRHLAQRLNVALGLTNSYLRRCVRKGLIKIHQAPANRYLYYLTPKGFAEKSRLTGEFLSSSFAFYRQASDSCKNTLLQCKDFGWQRVLVVGTTELAEITAFRAAEHGIKIIGFYSPGDDKTNFVGRPVFATLNEIGTYDACVLTDHQHVEEQFRDLTQCMAEERVFVPDILGGRPQQRAEP